MNRKIWKHSGRKGYGNKKTFRLLGENGKITIYIIFNKTTRKLAKIGNLQINLTFQSCKGKEKLS